MGQTLGRSMRVAVKPGRQLRRSRSAGQRGRRRSPRARRASTERLRYYPPFRCGTSRSAVRGSCRAIAQLGARAPGATGASPATASSATGPRLPAGQAPRPVAPRAGRARHPSSSQSLAADTRGRRRRSRMLRVCASATWPPRSPAAPDRDRDRHRRSSSAGGLARERSSPGSATGSSATACLSRRSGASAARIRNLAPATGYRFSVAAVDSPGYRSSERVGPVAVTHRDAAADRGQAPRVPARVDGRELPRPPAPLPPDRHRLPDLLRLPPPGRGDPRQGRSARHALGADARASACCRASTASGRRAVHRS